MICCHDNGTWDAWATAVEARKKAAKADPSKAGVFIRHTIEGGFATERLYLPGAMDTSYLVADAPVVG